MNVLPIMTRELRVQARRAATFGLRVAGVLAAVVVFFVLCFGRALPAAEVGGRLFMSLHGVTLIFIWLAVPLLTADSIARERREGTFGLLFLTPLSPIDVLLGKLLVHFLAAMTLWVSILPVMIIPFVLGGVAAMDVISAVVLQGISIVLSLVAGLLASVWVKDLRWATALSVIFGAIFLVVLIESVKSELVRNGLPAGKSGRVWVATGRLTPIVMQNGVTGWAQGGVSLAAGADGLFWVGLTNWEATWAPNLGTWVGPGRSWRDSLRRLALLSAGMAMVVVAGCAARVRRLSRDQASSQREIWLYEKFCRPTVWVDLFQHRMSGSLNRNPIGWLHVRSVAGRLTMWIWVGVVTVLETYTVAAGWEIASSLQAFVGILLLIGMAYSSADSFRDERQSGALELILVTPIREGAILWGRLQGIWMQFLPAVAAFILAEIFFPWNWQIRPVGIWEIVASYFGLPVVGLYFSLQRLTAMTATLATAACWFAVPVIGKMIFKFAPWLWYSLHSVLVDNPEVIPGAGPFVLIAGGYAVIFLLGLVLYFFRFARKPGWRIFALLMVVTGVSPFFLMLVEPGRLGVRPISLLIAPMLVVECGRRLHQTLRERRFVAGGSSP